MSESGRSDTTETVTSEISEGCGIVSQVADKAITGLPDSSPNSQIDTSIFDVFQEFDLDLSCLSRPSSPAPSSSELPPSTPSPQASRPSSPVLARTTSFASQLTIMPRKPPKKVSSAQMSSTAPASSRGSWPLVKYAGRGTPIDRNRRLEWGGFSGEDVAEDGVLFTSVRSTSLDSARGPSSSQRSLSPDWNYLSPISSSISQSTHSETTSQRTASIYEPPPELAPLQILGEQDEWDSIMKTVLSPTLEAPEECEAQEEFPVITEDQNDRVEEKKSSENVGESPAATKDQNDLGAEIKPSEDVASSSPMMSPEQLEQLNSGLEIDLGLNAALDLGLGQKGGMNWFDLGLLPGSASASGRESPSVYSSQAHTPQPSAPPSIREEYGPASEHHRSNTSTRAETNVTREVKSGSPSWWRKIMVRFRRVHSLITLPIHKNRF